VVLLYILHTYTDHRSRAPHAGMSLVTIGETYPGYLLSVVFKSSFRPRTTSSLEFTRDATSTSTGLVTQQLNDETTQYQLSCFNIEYSAGIGGSETYSENGCNVDGMLAWITYWIRRW
jgi:hypothetical protein